MLIWTLRAFEGNLRPIVPRVRRRRWTGRRLSLSRPVVRATPLPVQVGRWPRETAAAVSLRRATSLHRRTDVVELPWGHTAHLHECRSQNYPISICHAVWRQCRYSKWHTGNACLRSLQSRFQAASVAQFAVSFTGRGHPQSGVSRVLKRFDTSVWWDGVRYASSRQSVSLIEQFRWCHSSLSM